MAKFSYKAKKGLDQTFEGTIEAENQDEALNKIIAQGLFPISITEAVIAKEEPKKTPRVKKISRKIGSSEILTFTQKLTTLIRAKVELLSSLKILYEQTENSRLQEIILEIYNATKEGKTFSESLSHFPNVFSPLLVNIVRAGEASGRLDSSLEQISEFLSRQEALKTKVRVALAYPTLLFFVGVVSIFVLINFVVPRLKPIFESLRNQLPLITKIILQISMLSNKTWWIILGIIALVVLILYQKKGGSFLRSFIKKIRNGIPVFRRLAMSQELAHFSQALALLLKSGVPVLKSLEVSTPTIEDTKLRRGLENVCKDVSRGESLSKSMGYQTNLPNFFTKMIAVGEESGRLTEVLDEISHSYTQQIESDIALITSLLEPILILVLGLILGSIVLAILLPTFQITQFVH